MKNNKRKAFTLLEMLICISLIGFLFSLTIAAVARAQEVSIIHDCKNNLRQIGIALANFETTNNAYPKTIFSLGAPRFQGKKITHLGWQVQILPFFGNENAYIKALSSCENETDMFKNPPHTILTLKILGYECKSVPANSFDFPTGVEFSKTSYLGVGGLAGKPGMFSSLGTKLSQVQDGQSNTLFVGERPAPQSNLAGTWYPGFIKYSGIGPNNLLFMDRRVKYWDDPCEAPEKAFGPGNIGNSCDRFKFWSLHRGGANFLFADGSVAFINYRAGDSVEAMSTREGGEIN